MNNKNIFIHKNHAIDTWASFDLVEEFIESMKRSLDFDYEYFINMSGQCYPIKNTKSINEFFNLNHGYSFIDQIDLSDYSSVSPRNSWMSPATWKSRFQHKYYRVPYGNVMRQTLSNIVGQSLDGKRTDINLYLKIPRIFNRNVERMNLYGGSTWFYLRKKHVEYIVDFIKDNKKFLEFSRRVWAPDEHFFQTIIARGYGKESIKDNNYRYIDWSKGIPAVLTFKDFDKIINSDGLFARKFDEDVDKGILDAIDNKILKA